MDQSSARVLIRTTCYVLILFATIIAIALVFLSQLDLNDYRLSLEKQLSSTLEQPVQIGHSSLTFNRGLALDLEDLRVGPDHAVLADIPKITATLKITPLFKGQLILDQMVVEEPKLQLWFPYQGQPSSWTSQRLVSSLGISLLSIRSADITIHYKQSDKKPQTLTLSNFNAILRGWKPGKTGRLTVSGQLQEHGGSFLLETQLPSSKDPEIWRNEKHQTQLKITNFSASEQLNPFSQGLASSLDLNLNIQGVPADGVLFTAALSNAKKQTTILSLSGLWKSSDQQEAVTHLKGELLKIPLGGEFYLLRKDNKNYLAGHFGAENVSLTPKMLQAWNIPNTNKFIDGNLERLTINVKKNWDPQEKFSGLPQISAAVTICDLDWELPRFKQFQDLSVDLSLLDKTLRINDGIIVGADQSIDFSGQIKSLFKQPQINLKFSFLPQVGDLPTLIDLPEDWDLSGKVPGDLHLTGPLAQPNFSLKADFSSTQIHLGQLFRKYPSDQLKLQLRGNLKHNRLNATLFSLALNDLTISGEGQYHSKRGFQVELKPIDLDKLTTFSPLLYKIQTRGVIKGSLRKQNNEVQGTFTLIEAGAHLTSVIGDLNRTSGTINLDQHGFTFHDLQASLGESDFSVDGTFVNWKNPQLDLDLKGEKVRAQDLIFANQHLTLHDLNGHLQIDADAIRFSPIHVKLEEDTLATVNGEVTFKAPKVSLDIQSDQVDVLDIIDLFIGPKKTTKKPNNNKPPLSIKVSAMKGTLGGLHFQNADGLITGDNERLTIFPLSFNNGDGWCQSRIVLEYGQDKAPLKISGHAEGIDASVLHQKLFEKRGLVSGKLKGDFYIEGSPGDGQFWEGAQGGIHAQISNGTLRKFHGLAKVFSLLNVSQIFAGKLPDMNKEGMPFTLLEGNFKIGSGKAITDNLNVISEAMNLSVVGSQNLIDDTLDFTLGIKPLRTVDKIVTSIPIAGWILAGEEKALITAHFKIEGSSDSPKVTAIPIDSVSKTVFGIFKRTLGLPGKLVKDISTLFNKNPKKK